MATAEALQLDTKITITNTKAKEKPPQDLASPIKPLTPLKEYKTSSIFARIPSSYHICLLATFIFSLLLIVSFSAVYILTSTTSNCTLCDYQYTSCIVTNLTLNVSSSCPLRIEFLYGLNNDWDATQTICEALPAPEAADTMSIGQIQTCVIKEDDTGALTNINYPMYEQTNLLPLQFGWIYLTFLCCGVFLTLSAAAWSAWMLCRPSYDPAVIQERDHSCVCFCIFCLGLMMLFLLFDITEQLHVVDHLADAFDVEEVYSEQQCTIQGIHDIMVYNDAHSAFSVVLYDIDLVNNDQDNGNALVAAQIVHDLADQDSVFYNDSEYHVSAEWVDLLKVNTTHSCLENVDTQQLVLVFNNDQSQPHIDWLDNHIAGISKSFDALKIAFVFLVCPCVYLCVFLQKKYADGSCSDACDPKFYLKYKLIVSHSTR